MYARLAGRGGGQIQTHAPARQPTIHKASLTKPLRRKLPPSSPGLAAIGAQIMRNTGNSMFASLASNRDVAGLARGCWPRAKAQLWNPGRPKPRLGTPREAATAVGFQLGHTARDKANPSNGRRSDQTGPVIGIFGPGAQPKAIADANGGKSAIGGESATQWLQARLQEQLQRATWKKGQVFLDLFSGKKSPMGRQVAKRGGAYIAFDLLIDARFDLNNPEVEQLLLRWLRCGLVWGFWLGTDCTTWSRASYSKGPGWYNSYRSLQNLWGELGQLSPKAKQKVLEGNKHTTFSLRMLEAVANQPTVVAGMENPARSVIWLLPELLALERKYPGRIHQSTCDYCQYGKPWRKATTFLWVGTAHDLAPCKKCKPTGRHLCSRTGRAHCLLGQGRKDPSTRRDMALGHQSLSIPRAIF